MSTKIRVAVRVDGDNATGMGHVVECLTLVDGLKRRADCEPLFITKGGTPAAASTAAHGYALVPLPQELERNGEIVQVRQALERWHPDVLIVNLRQIEDLYLQELARPGLQTVAIRDTLERRRLYANVIVNYHLGQPQDAYLVDPTTTLCCIGPAYVLLDEAFYQEWLHERPVSITCDSILINQGGSDPFGLTAKILRAIDALHLGQTVYVVVGAAVSAQHRAELDDLATRLCGRYVFKYNVGNQEMMTLMRNADLAITAAGNTLYELAVMGVPTIVVCHHENHNKAADLFAKKGAVVNLGIGEEIPEQLIADAVSSLLGDLDKRKLLHRNARQTLDGRGVARVAEAILSQVRAT